MFVFKPSNSIKIELLPNQWAQLSSKETLNNAFENEPVIAFDVYKDDFVIAFVLLRDCGEGFFLWDYAVDISAQGKGYGYLILENLINKLKFEYDAKWITTTYKYGNVIAEMLYQKLGFVQTDIIKDNEIHEVNMHLNL